MITGLFDPVAKTVDELHTSDEEKHKLKNKLTEIQNELTEKVLEYEKELLKSKTEIITAEATGKSWLQRNWRPILMLSVVAIIVNNYIIYPYLPESSELLNLPDGLWRLLQIGVGGYVVGRSAEKVAHDIKDKIPRNK
jgi:hypothetical protein